MLVDEFVNFIAIHLTVCNNSLALASNVPDLNPLWNNDCEFFYLFYSLFFAEEIPLRFIEDLVEEFFHLVTRQALEEFDLFD